MTVLKDGQIAATTVSGSDANFSVEIDGLSPGQYVFGAYATDINGIQSPLQSFSVTVTLGVTVDVGSIFLAPTLSGDKTQVKQGDNITFFGQATPSSQVTLSVHSSPEIFSQVHTDNNGVYLYDFDTSPLELGGHVAKSKVASDQQLSSYSNPFDFTVGTEDVKAKPVVTCPQKGDLNGDCRVNLVDFSIAAYWYKKTLTPTIVALDKKELNGDGKIDLIDFSIMAYYWTG